MAFAKVAEFQARSVVYFHAVVRLDGPDGALPPSWATEARLERAGGPAATTTSLITLGATAVASRVLTWGRQLDVRGIGGDDSGEVSDAAVARYVAKYATKSTETAGVELRSLACRGCAGTGTARLGDTEVTQVCRDCHGIGRRPGAANDLDGLSPHALALIDACWRLGGMEELAGLKLRRWACCSQGWDARRDPEAKRKSSRPRCCAVGAC